MFQDMLVHLGARGPKCLTDVELGTLHPMLFGRGFLPLYADITASNRK